ncbi:hypothetical protein [Calycomorphotria hydatis]|uniref:Uncharacterized protein n=1 Tax=Calycomorphotria hydatis TaxID=2528027 RepID=A0A517T418_9PLAN|nr:hypothetical protein [Calycomorphotria hydatis]QDT63126.1 hypothetical protein V22_03260 [Calycomorphotria hydatis]
MPGFIRCASVFLFLGPLLTLPAAQAQQFRVMTTVYQSGEPTPVSRSLTLFHAGKVYDYVDAMDEVILFEPATEQFLILNSRYGLTTKVQQEELRHLLNQARVETERKAATMAGDISPAAKKILASFAFQLAPEFKSEFDEPSNTLKLTGGPLAYTITGTQVERTGLTTAYLEYADWMCQLNYVLHPSPLFPDVRLAVNDALRRRDLFPIRVQLEAEFDQPVMIHAEHSIQHDLGDDGRRLITQWERMLKSPKTKSVVFREYQRLTHDATDAR